jgi:hypothetical protein
MVGQSHILTDEKEEQAALWARVVLCCVVLCCVVWQIGSGLAPS